MLCPNCQFENRDEAIFCRNCGTSLKCEISCSNCAASNPPDSQFCEKCGHKLELAKTPSDPIFAPESLPPRTTEEKSSSSAVPIESERKHVTVLFSDITGYSEMSERIDPEEIKDITTHLFDEISKIISEYEGFIEKFAGDAVMAIFGATTAQEDDPVRAINAARKIHNLVNSLSPQYEKRIERPLSMHTGINTGLVVTGEVNLEKGVHGIVGDGINMAARLSDLAKDGEIYVASDTYYQSQGHFDFEELEPVVVKGKSDPFQIFKVLSAKEQPVKVHRLDGYRAELIGRNVEMNRLADAVKLLKEGKGSIISICGAAGTGKSRLVRDFKYSLNLEEFQWLEGHAYPHSQNITYYPLIDILNKALQIKEGDPLDQVREKVESGISSLVGEIDEVVPYIGSLFSLHYPEIEDVSPEFWKTQLQKAVQTTIFRLAQRAPTIICLEDLHWTDPSSLELIRLILSNYRNPILFLCIYRPIISLFAAHQTNLMLNQYHEIRLQDLSPSESQIMVESLLKTKVIPTELQRFVQEKIEGNPFYIEETLNSLIESKILVRDNGKWKTTQSITDLDIPSSIHGVISGRLDRLEKETKRILQEASVIGRSFLHEILKRITQIKEHMDKRLNGLEKLDLLKIRTIQPDLEYIFKHALTQEVVYNGLLKKERREIHERIGSVMEQIFQDRISEFYETLAYHFKQGLSVLKAVDYLAKSGEKSLKRYAVEESHLYYKEAFELLTNQMDKSREKGEQLIDLLIKWALVYYYRGDFKGLTDLLIAHEDIALSVRDKAKLGMYYAWLGFCLFCRNQLMDSYNHLSKAIEIGEEIENNKVIGYACTWFTWTCGELGLLDEAVVHGERAQEIFRSLESDQYIFFKSLAGMGYTYFFKGESKKLLEAGEALLAFGKKHSTIRSLSLGHSMMSFFYLLVGSYTSAIESSQKAIQVAQDPWYSHCFKLGLGFGYIYTGSFEKAEKVLKEVDNFGREFGVEWMEMAHMWLGVVSIGKGHMNLGSRMLKDGQQACLHKDRRSVYVVSEYIFGKIYSQILQREGDISLSSMIRNIGFLMKNMPFAFRKAENHFNRAIEAGKKIGSNGILGHAYLDLGLLYKTKKIKMDKARKCFSEALIIFKQCDAEVFVDQAQKALASLR